MAKTVLIIEDDEYIRSALEEVLLAEGYNTCTARNGREALELLRSAAELPDLILLDLMMPVMNGHQVREALAQDPRLSGIPVIVLSANGYPFPGDYVRKPIDLEPFLELLRKRLQ
jgi:CheY-like chemotaxis protein